MRASRITGRNPNSQVEVFVQFFGDAASRPRFDHGSDANQCNGFRIVRLEVRTQILQSELEGNASRPLPAKYFDDHSQGSLGQSCAQNVEVPFCFAAGDTLEKR